MTPTERALQVLEYLMSAGPGPIKQVDIARECNVAPATLNRIIRDLSRWGYLFRTSEKYCVRNFRLERNVPMSEAYLKELDSTIRALTDALGVSSEVVVVAGHELLWHSRTDHPDPSVVIRATAGFRRSLYELDALSRLYLSRLPWSDIEARFYTEGFYDTGYQSGRDIRWFPEREARNTIESERTKDFVYDLQTNHLGNRRFATLINDPRGGFLHLLSINERPQKGQDDRKTIHRYAHALSEARERLMTLVAAEQTVRRRPPQHYSTPGRGG